MSSCFLTICWSSQCILVFITNVEHQPASQIYFGKLFPNEELDWTVTYILPGNVTINSYLCNFQYKMLNNIFK